MDEQAFLASTARTLKRLFPYDDFQDRLDWDIGSPLASAQYQPLLPLIHCILSAPDSNEIFEKPARDDWVRNEWVRLAQQMYQVVEVADEVNPHLSDRQQRVLDDIVDRRYQMGALLGNQYDQFSVPAFLWTNPRTFWHAARVIARTWAWLRLGAMPTDAQVGERLLEVYAGTERIRREFHRLSYDNAPGSVLAFPGWLPLDFAPTRATLHPQVLPNTPRVRQYDQDHDPNIAFFFSPWCPLHITDTTMLNTDDSQAAERDWVSDVPVAPPLNPDTDTGTGTETDTAQETDTDTETEPETTRTTTPVAIRLTLTHRRVHIVRHMRY